VLCSSYSGNTEETLACFDAAEALGARRLVVSTGGALVDRAREAGVPVVGLPGIFQPRVAVAYMFASAAEVAALAGVAPRVNTEIDVAAAFLEREALTIKAKASELAAKLDGGPIVVYGADLTVPVAQRWKTQVNENAKLPCFAHDLPELDHNELVGWEGAAELGRFAAVFLDDPDLHPRLRQRIELTRGLIAAEAAATFRLESVGTVPTERIISLVLLGDLVSLYLAVLRGVDPGPVAMIDRLKTALTGSA
jgi:glucose/mannose-6-phosphate isomerase